MSIPYWPEFRAQLLYCPVAETLLLGFLVYAQFSMTLLIDTQKGKLNHHTEIRVLPLSIGEPRAFWTASCQ